MRKMILLALTGLGAPALAQGVYVAPHVNADGTFVQGHYRSAPNGTTEDNWSTKGNVSPHTGQEGTRNPQPRAEPYNPYVPRRPANTPF